MRLFSEAHYKFIEKRRAAYVVSAAALIVGVGAMIANIFVIGSWQNYGVDFTGGSLVEVRFVEAQQVGDIRAAVSGDPVITEFGSDTEFLVRAPLAEDATIEDVAERVEEELVAAFGTGNVEVVRQELVSAKVGEELVAQAGWAILFSFALTLIYIAIRFEWRFGFAAIIATFHDMIITLGFLALFRVEIALPTVAAILTILGYSLNDTIVVFDRIRENLQKKGARKRDPIELINASINETLPRTILTSGTTLAVLLALLLLGGAVLADFTVVLILGVLIGTYSSIFVASPALLEIQRRFGEGKSKERRPKPQPATV